MDYCSWSKSTFKISWDYDPNKLKEEQILEVSSIEDTLEITFRDVLANCKDSVDNIVKFLDTPNEALKIKSFVKRFKLDVDDEFRGVTT